MAKNSGINSLRSSPKAIDSVTVVTSAVLVMLVSYGTQCAFGVFFKPISDDFGWTKALTSGAFSLSFFICGLLGIVMGAYCDRYGSRGIVTFCAIVLGAGYLLMSLMNDVWQFYLFYGVMIGVGMSGLWVPIMSTIARRFHEKKNLITAIAMAGGGVGSMLGPIGADWMISSFDWRKAFVIFGVLVLVINIACAQFLKNAPACAGLNALKRGEPAVPSQTTGFTLKEAMVTGRFWILNIMIFCLGFCAYVFIVHLAPHAIELGLSSAIAANILATVSALSIAGRLGLASFSARLGNRMIYIIGFILIATSSFLFVFTGEMWALFLLAAVFGFGWGAGAAQSPLVAELFGLKSHGLILGITVLAYSIGSATGPIVAGYLNDVTGDYQLSFIVSACVGVIGLISAVLIRKPEA